MSTFGGANRTATQGFKPEYIRENRQVVSNILDWAPNIPPSHRYCINHPGRRLANRNPEDTCFACQQEELNSRFGVIQRR